MLNQTVEELINEYDDRGLQAFMSKKYLDEYVEKYTLLRDLYQDIQRHRRIYHDLD